MNETNRARAEVVRHGMRMMTFDLDEIERLCDDVREICGDLRAECGSVGDADQKLESVHDLANRTRGFAESIMGRALFLRGGLADAGELSWKEPRE
jgi:hypothetical protein